jgi:hypothetical protein
MGGRSEGVGLHHRGAHRHDLGRAATNLLLKANGRPELSRRSTDVTAWVSHFGARKLRVGEAIAELERANRVFLESRCAPAKDKLAEGRSDGDQTVLNPT